MTTLYPDKRLCIAKKRTLHLLTTKIWKTELILHLFRPLRLSQAVLNESILRWSYYRLAPISQKLFEVVLCGNSPPHVIALWSTPARRWLCDLKFKYKANSVRGQGASLLDGHTGRRERWRAGGRVETGMCEREDFKLGGWKRPGEARSDVLRTE